MLGWVVLVIPGSLAAVAALVGSGVLHVRRYSVAHVVEGRLAVAGRGLFFSRTPDGIWWRVRLRARRCTTTYPADWGDPPPEDGVREPRRPLGPPPRAAQIALHDPGH